MADGSLPEKPPSSLDSSDLVQLLLPSAVSILENDFRTCGIDPGMEGKLFPSVFGLRDFISTLMEKQAAPGSEAFFRLLYRNDLPEKKAMDALAAENGQRDSEKIAELIIIRALQRAFYRMKYG
ncbi:MAG TPA: hypothetical protein VFU15_11115 [Bacteroidia bacterium]|nr:hypothetical protein [Bacteroidia bacterium]